MTNGVSGTYQTNSFQPILACAASSFVLVDAEHISGVLFESQFLLNVGPLVTWVQLNTRRLKAFAAKIELRCVCLRWMASQIIKEVSSHEIL